MTPAVNKVVHCKKVSIIGTSRQNIKKSKKKKNFIFQELIKKMSQRGDNSKPVKHNHTGMHNRFRYSFYR